VTNEEPDSLKSKLVAAYQTYLRNPSIDVTMLRRVNILGEVRSPGLHPVDPTMTLADAIALAGGLTPLGNANKIEVRRDGMKLAGKLTGRTRISDSPVRSGDQIYVGERSWLSRNTTLVATGVSATVSILIALLR
jgi:polysaccharide export outer membrane protein